MRNNKHVNADQLTRERARGAVRTGCKANIALVKKHMGPNWIVSNFIETHNHPLSTPSKVLTTCARMLGSLHTVYVPTVSTKSRMLAYCILNCEILVHDMLAYCILNCQDASCKLKMKFLDIAVQVENEVLASSASGETTGVNMDFLNVGALHCSLIALLLFTEIDHLTIRIDHRPKGNGNGNAQKRMIHNWIKTLHEEKRDPELVDKDLNDAFNSAQLETAVEVILLCTSSNPALRLKMSEVVKILESIFGPTEQTEETHGEVTCCRSCSSSKRSDGANEASSVIIEAIELSGPR
ncbi:protein NSP-INTERACTING KINASE 1-like [Zingiber officinale]|uniref:protein NSP-INTERACTING KINASE 1-like n=1 Tax=Zingiber officinale TaxID=94328 RepID=UPI001C4AF373|nr:protein NSP-INTERACTING KINASE 1-like [Zingiber officinale]